MIFLPHHIPLIQRLNQEGYPAQERNQGSSKTIKIGLLNLMPFKEETEYHFARIFSTFYQPVELCLLKLNSHLSKNTPLEYIEQFYEPIDKKISDIDLFIFTGAPVEEIPFEEVTYWEEMQLHFNHIKQLQKPLITICWSAQAGLYHFYQIPKILIPQKAFGVFENTIYNDDAIIDKLDQIISMPVSRHSDIDAQKVAQHPSLKIILGSDKGGLFLIKDKENPFIYITGHPEYSAEILKNEYYRDLQKKRQDVAVPYNYNLESPKCFWQKNATQLYHNIAKELLHQ